MRPFIDYQYDIPYIKKSGHSEITYEERERALSYLKRIKFKGHTELFGNVDFSNEPI